MAANREEQQNVIEKVREILSTYHTRDAVREELESLGFDVRAEHGDVVSLENTHAEIFVQIFVNDRGDLFDSHVVTFDELELKPRAKD
ncbi:hypothetical protein KH990_12700 [Methanoculleus bourgensis]|jgi:hypothetical protein|uniref:Uncharacterized protein n=2 Tax=Methanoculleus bourgensis TaxID=83986 RepID=A0A0X3BP67_9EURY|nr:MULTISPECIES: hypothetical protein [Methanoculleus]MBT0734208.1 hypothetical protein [Methanoculleus bourgensis]NMA89035.1 hypothetical protein [Methanoculleus bourgensis]NQS77999.1 hypothetical protein [Methanoculleus bourgensis]CCJ36955.1 hypothetical protein BN140_2032 [Methanoculleus bourgensis MS2]CVK33848.1 conserved protein of unknown function [Methanoculleus bourgensis]